MRRHFSSLRYGHLTLVDPLSPEDVWACRDDLKKNVFASLPADEREVHFLRHDLELSVEQVAERTGLSRSDVVGILRSVAEKIHLERAKKALSRMPHKTSQVYFLCEREELSYKEIAVRLDMSVEEVVDRHSEAERAIERWPN